MHDLTLHNCKKKSYQFQAVFFVTSRFAGTYLPKRLKLLGVLTGTLLVLILGLQVIRDHTPHSMLPCPRALVNSGVEASLPTQCLFSFYQDADRLQPRICYSEFKGLALTYRTGVHESSCGSLHLSVQASLAAARISFKVP